jgi:hypothetical protein
VASAGDTFEMVGVSTQQLCALAIGRVVECFCDFDKISQRIWSRSNSVFAGSFPA